MKEKYVLVKLFANYADEFDTYSLWVTTEEEYNNFIDKISKSKEEDVEVCFGTNEDITFFNSEDLLDQLEVKTISEEFYNEFLKIMEGNTFGTLDIPYLLEAFGIEEDE
jgi:hypothetical protein